MKILFLTYHGFNTSSGITKKMFAQVKGLRQNGHEVHLCCYQTDKEGCHCRFVDDEVLANYGPGWMGSLRQRFGWGAVRDYCVQNGIELVYVRSYMNASPWLVRFFRQLREAGIHSVMEIPTYPYDREFSDMPFIHRFRLLVDKCFCRSLAAQNTAVVTFSDETRIFGQRTIRISNGVDLEAIPLHQVVDASHEVHLIGVAEVHPWHGFDRLLEGMGRYLQQGGMERRPVYFHIVGSVYDSEMYGTSMGPGFAPIIEKYGLHDYVLFHGKLFGDDLDRVFEQCAFAVGSLARHRCGITTIKTLKNREYASRGIPFVYSECDSDFDHQPYVLKVPADERPVGIGTILDFMDQHHFRPESIRQTVEHLSWKIQMEEVIRQYRQLINQTGV